MLVDLSSTLPAQFTPNRKATLLTMTFRLDLTTLTPLARTAQRLAVNQQLSEGLLLWRELLGSVAGSREFPNFLERFKVSFAPILDNISVETELSKIIETFASSGYATQAVRVMATCIGLEPQARDILLDALGGLTGKSSETTAKAPKEVAAAAEELAAIGKQFLDSGQPEGIALIGCAHRVLPSLPLSVADIAASLDKLPDREPVLLKVPEAQELTQAAYDLHYSGRQEAAVRVGALVPSMLDQPAARRLFTKLEDEVSPAAKEVVQTSQKLLEKGYPAEAATLLIDSDSVAPDALWASIDKDIVRPNPDLKAPSRFNFYKRRALGGFADAFGLARDEKTVTLAEEAAQEAEPPSALQERYFRVTLEGGPLDPDRTVYVNSSLTLSAPESAETAASTAQVDTAEPRVAFICSAEGFVSASASSVQVDIFPDRDTDPVIFKLIVRQASRHRITVSAYQRGVMRGQVVIQDVAALLRPPQPSSGDPGSSRSRTEKVTGPTVAPSLSLDLNGPQVNILASSPPDVLDWNAQDMEAWRAPAASALDLARKHVAGLYENPPAPRNIDREFIILGNQIAKVLPEKLIKALADPRVNLLSIEANANFDFPFDLCKISVDGRDALVQDRMAIARWFNNTHAIRYGQQHLVSQIAHVVGKMKQDPSVEQEVFGATPVESFDTYQSLIDEVFKTRRFDLMHYFGHSGKGADDGPDAGRYLSLARDTQALRLQDIGGASDECVFFSRNPLVILNCCEGTQPSVLLAGPESFPHSFIDQACIACVGTIWPVDSRAANRFMALLYHQLAQSAYFPAAVRSARDKLLEQARDSATEPAQRLYLTLAARAYVYYGPPDLRCQFERRP